MNRYCCVILVFTIACVTGGAPACACELCDGPSRTLGEQYADADVLAVARCLTGKDAPEEEDSEFEIVSIERDPARELRVGQRMTLKQKARPARVLLVGSWAKQGDAETIAWGDPIEWSDAVAAYVRKAPGKEAADRLRYFEKFLEHSEVAIANDAWGEFANAPFEKIKPIAKEFAPETLRAWLTNPKTPANRLSLYGLMLGLCGGSLDAAELEKRALRLEQGPDAVVDGVHGITGGYLLLTGEDGLTKLEQQIVHNPDVAGGPILDRLRGIRFMWTYGEDRIPKARLRESLRPLVVRSDLAEMVIPDLSRWKDWSVRDKVAAMYGDGDPKKATVSLRRAVIRYLIECAKDVPPDAKAKPAHAVEALAHIERLRKLDPKVVEQVLKSYGPPKSP